jgi:2-polyprenyl-6-methoxyphenol hydroxylase-like FAD-dependent oxidoreductase
MEVLDQLGLADRLLTMPHSRMQVLRLVTRGGSMVLANLGRLRTRFPFITLMPQAAFLDFLAAEARRYPAFRLILGANVLRLVEEGGAVRGVRFQTGDDWQEVRAPLTVAADGRFSRLRKLAGLEPIRQSPPMDVIWFRLPRRPDDGHDPGTLFAGGGYFLVLLERPGQWQAGYVIPKGGFQDLKAGGLPAVQQAVVGLVPWLADRVGLLDDWKHFNVLAVESSRLPCWHRPGLLLIGDAAHVMSPVAGVGINVAIGDAVETANVLTDKLRTGRVDDGDLAAVQRRREWSVRVIQAFQGFLQKRLVKQALDPSRPFRLPLLLRLLLRLPGLRGLPARLVAFGPRRVRLERAQEAVRND